MGMSWYDSSNDLIPYLLQPDFYPLGGDYVVKASTSNGDLWFLGNYNIANQSFVPFNIVSFRCISSTIDFI